MPTEERGYADVFARYGLSSIILAIALWALSAAFSNERRLAKIEQDHAVLEAQLEAAVAGMKNFDGFNERLTRLEERQNNSHLFIQELAKSLKSFPTIPFNGKRGDMTPFKLPPDG